MSKKARSLLEVMSAIALSYLVTVLVFSPDYRQQDLGQHDMEQFREAAHELVQSARQKKAPVYWTSSIFSGMPTYTIKKASYGNHIKHISDRLARPISGKHVGFLISMLAMFFLSRHLQLNFWMCMVLSLLFAFGTNNVVAYRAGHLAKIESLAMMPLIFLAIEVSLRGRIIVGSLILTLGSALLIEAYHAQIAFYGIVAVLVYLTLRLPWWLRQRTSKKLLHLLGGWSLALVIALGCNANLILTTLDYMPLSTRGDAVLEGQDRHSGLTWEDGRPFAVGLEDLFTTCVPRGAGGSSEEYVAHFGRLVQAFSDKTGGPRLQVGDSSNIVSTYWGSQIQSEGPLYLGIVLLVLATLCFFFCRNIWNTWALIMLILGIALNVFMGEWLHHSIPLFDKFRAHGSIMLVVYFAMLMSVVGSLSDFLKKSKQKARLKAWKKTALACTVLFVFILLVSIGNDYHSTQDAANIAQSVEQKTDQVQVQNMLQFVRKKLFYRDYLRSLFFAVLSLAFLFFGWVRKKRTTNSVLLGLLALALIDIMIINFRYLNQHQYSKSKSERPMELQRAIDFIDGEMVGHGRIFNAFEGDPFSSATLAKHFNLVNGYNPAKLRRYDDVIKHYLRREDRTVLNMLNTEYKIERDGRVLRNRSNFGNAWLVDRVEIVNSHREEFDSLGSDRLRDVAFVHHEFADKISADITANPKDSIKLISYEPERLVYRVSSANQRFAVFSEIWYGPDKGWTAKIDGVEQNLVRANYILRAMMIKPGNYEIVFSFEPTIAMAGQKISTFCSMATLVMLSTALILWLAALVSPKANSLLGRLL